VTLPANPQQGTLSLLDAMRPIGDRADKRAVLAAVLTLKRRGIGVNMDEMRDAIDAYLEESKCLPIG
jgi:hypothetical protein